MTHPLHLLSSAFVSRSGAMLCDCINIEKGIILFQRLLLVGAVFISLLIILPSEDSKNH